MKKLQSLIFITLFSTLSFSAYADDNSCKLAIAPDSSGNWNGTIVSITEYKNTNPSIGIPLGNFTFTGNNINGGTISGVSCSATSTEQISFMVTIVEGGSNWLANKSMPTDISSYVFYSVPATILNSGQTAQIKVYDPMFRSSLWQGTNPFLSSSQK